MTKSAIRLLGIHEVVLVMLLGTVLGAAAWLDPVFVAPRTQLDIAMHALELALLALPMTLIIITGGIDLSVGSAMALASVALGLLHEAGASMWLACAAAVGVGAAAGALNGFFVARVRVHPLLITLATLSAYRGLAEGISRGRPISGFPNGFLELGSGLVLGVPSPLVVVIAAGIAAAVVTSRTIWGVWVYAAGGNERAAAYCGVPVLRLQFILYTLSGLAAGLCAVLFAARRNTAKADVGAGIELEVITAVVLGGTSIFGGKGTIIGTVLGVLVVHELREFVSWRWGHDEIVQVVIGATLIGSVLLTNLASRRTR